MKVGDKVLVPMTGTAVDEKYVSVSRFGQTWHLFKENVLYPWPWFPRKKKVPA